MIMGILLLVVIVVLSISLSRRRGVKPAGSPKDPSLKAPLEKTAESTGPTLHPYVASLLDRWISAGILPVEQAEQIRQFELQAVSLTAEADSRPVRRFPAVAEGLGYLGGVLGVVGVITLISAYWSDWSGGAQIGVTGIATIVLIGAGLAVREESDPSLARLRWFLWTGSTPSAGMFAYVLATDVFHWERIVLYWLAISLTTGVLNGFLWANRRRPIQETVFFASAVVAVGTAFGSVTDTHWAGLAVWTMGIILIVFSLVSKPSLPFIPAGIGAMAVIVGGYMTVSQWQGWGFLFVAISAAVLVASGTLKLSPLRSPFDALLGVIGVIGLLQSVPGVLVYFAKDAGVITGVVLWALGVSLFLGVRAHLVRVELVFQIVGGIAVLVGPAITGAQSVALATVSGLAVSILLIVLGMRPGQVLLSMFGLLGLLVFVPWSIGHFFPGEGRVPLLITVSGVLIVAIAVVLSRMSGRIRTEFQESGSMP